jgi:hypothetical protein
MIIHVVLPTPSFIPLSKHCVRITLQKPTIISIGGATIPLEIVLKQKEVRIMNASTDIVTGANIKMTNPKVDVRVNNDGDYYYYYYYLIPFLFVRMLNQRPKGQ